MSIFFERLAKQACGSPHSDSALTRGPNQDVAMRVLDGRYELYKSRLKYDSDLGRSQHGCPLPLDFPCNQLPAPPMLAVLGLHIVALSVER
jgi:hypothetical protein